MAKAKQYKGVTNADGHIGSITFSLTGPPELLSSVVKYIKNLTRITNT